jgi:hypothetical protein
MARGGARPGSGRKPGATTKKTRALAVAAAETGLAPFEVLMFWMNKYHEAGDGPAAVDAATRAAPFIHPRLSAVALDLTDLTDEQLRAAAAE